MKQRAQGVYQLYVPVWLAPLQCPSEPSKLWELQLLYFIRERVAYYQVRELYVSSHHKKTINSTRVIWKPRGKKLRVNTNPVKVKVSAPLKTSLHKLCRNHCRVIWKTGYKKLVIHTNQIIRICIQFLCRNYCHVVWKHAMYKTRN